MTEWLARWQHVLLHDTTTSWIRLLPKILQRSTDGTQETGADGRAHAVPTHDACVILQFIKNHARHDVEEMIMTQPPAHRETLQRSVAGVTAEEICAFLEETDETDIDDMLRHQTTHEADEHEDDDGGVEPAGGDDDDMTTHRLRQFLHTRCRADRAALLREWEEQHNGPDHDHNNDPNSHIMRRTTWKGKVFGQQRQHCLDYVALDLGAHDEHEAGCCTNREYRETTPWWGWP